MEPAMRTDVERRRQLLERVGRMNARMRRLEAEVGRADNTTRFHMERHLQSLSEFLVDVNARAIAMPDEAGPPRQLERDAAAAEEELTAVEAKLVAVRAEGRGDIAAAVRADLRAMAAQGSALRDELAVRPWGTEQDKRKGLLATRTGTLIAAAYVLEHSAIADYQDVRTTYESPDIRGTLDAAVISRRADGKVHIVKSVERTRHGPVAGLAARGMSRRDLKDLGDLLGHTESGLVVVADADVAPRAEAAITRAKTVVNKQVEFDALGLRTKIDSLRAAGPEDLHDGS
jgi:hypothetical protein